MKKNIYQLLLVAIVCTNISQASSMWESAKKAVSSATTSAKKAVQGFNKTVVVHNQSNKNIFFKFQGGTVVDDNLYQLAPAAQFSVSPAGTQLAVVAPKRAAYMSKSEITVQPTERMITVVLKGTARKTVEIEEQKVSTTAYRTVKNGTEKTIFVRWGESNEKVTILKPGAELKEMGLLAPLTIVVASSSSGEPIVKASTEIPVEQTDVYVKVKTDFADTPKSIEFSAGK